MRDKLLLNGILLISFVKLVMNQYQCLHDLSLTVFFLVLNYKLLNREVSGIIQFLFFCVIGFGLLNSCIMWITWTMRFSGNANFYWFQTFEYNAFVVIFFIHLYLAVDTKRKRYSDMIN